MVVLPVPPFWLRMATRAPGAGRRTRRSPSAALAAVERAEVAARAVDDRDLVGELRRELPGAGDAADGRGRHDFHQTLARRRAQFFGVEFAPGAAWGHRLPRSSLLDPCYASPMLPLDDLVVLDLSRILSGPYCSMYLGDFGARVIKLEHPDGGDDTRGFGPPFVGGESTYFMSINRNKESVAIDFKHARGRELLRALAARADILLENFRPGALTRLGLDYDAARALNPRLIYCSISGFGHAGDPDWVRRPGYDLAIQGMGGPAVADRPRRRAAVQGRHLDRRHDRRSLRARRHPGRAARARAHRPRPARRRLDARRPDLAAHLSRRHPLRDRRACRRGAATSTRRSRPTRPIARATAS